VLLFPSIIVLALITLPPFFYTIYLSLVNRNLTMPFLPTKFVGLANYARILTDSRALNSFRVTVMFLVGVVATQFIIGLLLTVLIDKYFRRHTWLITLIVLPMALPRVVVSLLWRLMYNPLIGIINYLMSSVGLPMLNWLSDPKLALRAIMIVDIWQWTPFIILLLLAGFETLPQTPYEAAKVDGATGLQCFWYITLPLLKPIMVVAVLFRTIDALRTFDAVFMLTNGGPGIATETVDVFAYYIGIAESGNISLAAAVSVVVVLLTVGFANLFLRRVQQWETY
jgi:multiple sugar transport system permease protein